MKTMVHQAWASWRGSYNQLQGTTLVLFLVSFLRKKCEHSFIDEDTFPALKLLKARILKVNFPRLSSPFFASSSEHWFLPRPRQSLDILYQLAICAPHGMQGHACVRYWHVLVEPPCSGGHCYWYPGYDSWLGRLGMNAQGQRLSGLT